MKRRLKQLLAMICTVSIIMTLPGLTAFAEEIEGETVVETVDDIDSSSAVEDLIPEELDQNVSEDSVTESIGMDVQDEINKGAEMDMEDPSVSEGESEDKKLGDFSESPDEQADEESNVPDTELDAQGDTVIDEQELIDLPSQTDLAEEMLAQIEADISNADDLVGADTSSSDPGFEVYNAEARIKGLEGSGAAAFDILMGTDMIYQQLAEYAMEEKSLYYSSGLWIGFFDELFKNCPMYGYETVLMDYLAFDAESAETKNSLEDAMLDFSVDLAKAGMKLTEVNVDTYNEFVNSLTKEQAVQLGQSVIDKTALKLTGDAFDLALLSANTAEDVISNLAEITAASKKRQKQVAFLNMVKENLSEDDYWLKWAFEDIVGTYGNANLPVMMMQGASCKI